MEITALFTHDRLAQNTVQTPHLLISIKAPTPDGLEKRPQLCVLPVIDLSGSMGGPKLEYAKQSLLKLVDQLQDGDLVGLIGFESQVHVLFEPKVADGGTKDKLRQAIRGLRARGGTNFAGGMLKAVQVIQDLDLPPTFLKRVIMFTDGEPTEGVVDKKQILSLLERTRGPLSMSAFGYGGSGVFGCDQEFLTTFAATAQGNYAYVQNPDDALAAFGKELGGLLSTYATDLALVIEPTEGNAIRRVVTDVKHDEDIVKTVTVPITDILAEETRHFVFETTLGAHRALPRELPAFDVKLTFSVLTEMGTKETREVATRARVRFVREADAQKEPHPKVDEVVALHRLIRTQLEAEALAKQGQFKQAQAVMTGFAGEVKTSGGSLGIRLGDYATQAAQFMADKHSYNHNQGYMRSVASGGTRAYGTSALHHDAAVLLGDCNVSVSNSAMDNMISNFTSVATPEPAEIQPLAGSGVLTPK